MTPTANALIEPCGWIYVASKLPTGCTEKCLEEIGAHWVICKLIRMF
jgi:hypothetical protein